MNHRAVVGIFIYDVLSRSPKLLKLPALKVITQSSLVVFSFPYSKSKST